MSALQRLHLQPVFIVALAVLLLAAVVFALTTGGAVAQSRRCTVQPLRTISPGLVVNEYGEWRKGDCTSIHQNREGAYSHTYSLTVDTRTRLLISVTSRNVDPVVYLVNNRGEIEGWNDDINKSNRNSHLDIEINAGVYWARVTTYHPRTEGYYQLSISANQPAAIQPHTSPRSSTLDGATTTALTVYVATKPTRTRSESMRYLSRKKLLAARLFKYDEKNQIWLNQYNIQNYAYYEYNDFGCPLSRDVEISGHHPLDCELWVPVPYRARYDPAWHYTVVNHQERRIHVAGYRGGHSGWDAQTISVAGQAGGAGKIDQPFYSLTAGCITYTGSSYIPVIDVYDPMHHRTTRYLHARANSTEVIRGQWVQVGDKLAIQGNTGLGFRDTTTREHVHVEVIPGSHNRSTFIDPQGAYWFIYDHASPRDGYSIDPIDYLYEAGNVPATKVNCNRYLR